MPKEVREEELLALPCRHCGALSIEVNVQAVELERACPRCRERTQVSVRREDGAWRVRTAALIK